MGRRSTLYSGIVLQLVLGGIYAWSAFVPGLTSDYGFTRLQSGFIFGLMIAVFAAATIPAGRVFQKYGPRRTASAGAVLYGAGYLAAWLSGGNYAVILAGIGVVGGAGVGLGYVCPLSAGMKWFPDKKGLITGVAVAGFGGGAVITSALADYLLNSAGRDVLEAFGLLGVLYGSAAFAAARFMSLPPGGEPAPESAPVMCHAISLRFAGICAGMFVGTFAGLLAVGNLSPLMISMGLSETAAAFSISMFAAGNVFGRIFWGRVHDSLGSRRTIPLSLAVLTAAMSCILFRLSPAAALLAAVFIGIGFGGCFVVYASSIAEIYGEPLFPRLYPICFLFYGAAALLGPPLGGWLEEASGWHGAGAAASVALLVPAAIAAFFINGRGDREEQG